MRFLPFVIIIVFGLNVCAQEEATEWDVNNPPFDFETVHIETEEGTWMNLDVSPDGKKIVFDLLGDIYTLDIKGGNAARIKGEISWDIQPRFSPDGQRISYCSDAGGGDNIWIMSNEGTNNKQVTKESFRLVNNADWTPDGNYIIAKKHFTSRRSLGAGEIWQYHINGGSGWQLTKKKNEQQDVNEPCVSPDGRYVYFSEDMYPGGMFRYNKDPNKQIYVIKRYDRQKDQVELITGGPGGACRPQISSDGNRLAYVRRIRTKSVLMVLNLTTGIEQQVYTDLDKDQQEAWALYGVYPGFDWIPGTDEIVIWAGGKIKRINSQNLAVSEIPFSIKTNKRIAKTLQFKNEAFEEKTKIQVIRQAKTSPDGKYIVFNAVGHLWLKKLPNGTPKKLTDNSEQEYDPSWSADGNKIIYVSWSDSELSAIKEFNFQSNNINTLSTKVGRYRTPSYSPDNKQIVYEKEVGNAHLGFTHAYKPGIYVMKLIDKEEKLIYPKGAFPVFDREGKRIFFQEGGYLFGNLTKSLSSCDTNGANLIKHLNIKYGQKVVISPDNQYVAWSELFKVYVAPMPSLGKIISLSHDTKAIKVTQIAKDAGINIHWSKDSKTVYWTNGDQYYSSDLNDYISFLNQSKNQLPKPDSIGIEIGLELKSDLPKGKIAITNARIITMDGDKIIENGTILINQNIIEAIGNTSSVKIPNDAFLINAKNKTVMPGIIDVHGHLGNFRYGINPDQQWEYYANLAFGVTTAHDPSSNSEMIFAQSERIKTGYAVGPRLFSTGTILYGADGDFRAQINSLEDAKSALMRTQAYGAFSVKSYNQPRRNQRQQVIKAAQDLNMLVMPEGGSTFYSNMTQIADGHTGVEHNIPVAPLYNDVLQFWSASNVHNTPTLIVNYGGINGEYYWYEKTQVWENERLINFTPRPIVDSRSRHRSIIPMEEYENGYIKVSKSCTKLQNAGVNINLGAHGQLQGLGAHWELWMLHQGGMTNMQALRSATLNGAKYLGMDHQIGALKRGMLADIIIIDGNPLENIYESQNIDYTIVNGRLYNAQTMNEIGNRNKIRLPFYFENVNQNHHYPLYNETGTHQAVKCLCGQ